MKQKIVIYVCSMRCHKCRQSKAMKVAAAMCGVDSVAIDGEHRDKLVVVGECVDSVELTRELRKKMGGADLLEVSEVKKKDEKKPSAPPAPPSNPPPPPVINFVCHHCCHPVGYAYNYSCYCFCHRY